MSIKYMTRVWQHSKHTGSALLLLLAIADNAGDNGWCFPGIEYLAEKTRMSTRQVIRLIQTVEKSGELTVMRGKGRRIVNKYHINIEKDGEIVCQKGDKMSPFSKENVTTTPEKVTPENEKVTSRAKKGDIAMSRESSLTVLTVLTAPEQEVEVIKEGDSDVVKAYKERIRQACEKGAEKQNGKISVTGYPVDVTEVIQVFCEFWDFRPPTTKAKKSYWIDGGRALLDACGEFGMAAIKEYHADYERYRSANKGEPPFTITSPNSIEGVVRKKAAEMRSKGREPSQDNTLPSAVYEIKGAVVTVGGRRFYNGKELIDERPQENNART